MTAEEKWDKLRAHVVSTVRETVPVDTYEQGFKAGMAEVLGIIKRFDKEGK